MLVVSVPEITGNGEPIVRGLKIHIPYASAEKLGDALHDMARKRREGEGVEWPGVKAGA